MIIPNKELTRMLKNEGRKFTLTMYINRFFDLTDKQLDYVLSWKEDKNGRTNKRNGLHRRRSSKNAITK